jgi:hypothetical protein
MTSKTAIAALAATLALCLPVKADPILPGYVFSGFGLKMSEDVAATSINGPGDFSVGTLAASVALTPAPFLAISGSRQSIGRADVDVQLTYWFEITGPEDRLVDVHVIASGSAIKSNSSLLSGADSFFTVQSNGIWVDVQSHSQGPWSFDQTVALDKTIDRESTKGRDRSPQPEQSLE